MLRSISRCVLAAAMFAAVATSQFNARSADAQCNNCNGGNAYSHHYGARLGGGHCPTCRHGGGLLHGAHGRLHGHHGNYSPCGDGQRVPTYQEVLNGGGYACRPREYGNPDLFYNYYVTPHCGTQAAQLYMSPHPVPARVGHTYYTYQPFYPHEWMYPHHRTYHRYYDCGRGLTRTSAHWYAAPIQAVTARVMHAIEIPR